MGFPILPVAVTALVAGIVQGTAGFAQGIILMIVLPSIFGVLKAGALSQFVSFFVCSAMVFMYRRYVSWKLCLRSWVLYFPVFFIIHQWAKDVDASILRPVLAIVLILISVFGVFFAKRIHVKANWKTVTICTTISAALDVFLALAVRPWSF